MSSNLVNLWVYFEHYLVKSFVYFWFRLFPHPSYFIRTNFFDFDFDFELFKSFLLSEPFEAGIFQSFFSVQTSKNCVVDGINLALISCNRFKWYSHKQSESPFGRRELKNKKRIEKKMKYDERIAMSRKINECTSMNGGRRCGWYHFGNFLFTWTEKKDYEIKKSQWNRFIELNAWIIFIWYAA